MEIQTKYSALIKAYAISLSLKTTMTPQEAYNFLQDFGNKLVPLVEKNELTELIRIQ